MTFIRRMDRVVLHFHPIGMAERPEFIEVEATDWNSGERRAIGTIKEIGGWLADSGFIPVLGVPVWVRHV